jgi:hypothetical protein
VGRRDERGDDEWDDPDDEAGLAANDNPDDPPP